jgi:hypothetical protein
MIHCWIPSSFCVVYDDGDGVSQQPRGQSGDVDKPLG